VCLDDDTLTVTFTPGVYFNLEDSLKLCLGNVQTLSPEILLSDYVSSMLWSTGETEPTINVTAEGNYIFTISNICETMTDSVYITVKNCDIEMPNVFSPNGDGINDLYHIKGDDEIFKEFHIVILNRWGNVINEYDDPSGTWNGTDHAGNYVPTGVYFYKVNSVTLQDEVLEKEGFIHVVY
jgi:gliding motility-associated-like protein